jgi:hypothetical protein
MRFPSIASRSDARESTKTLTAERCGRREWRVGSCGSYCSKHRRPRGGRWRQLRRPVGGTRCRLSAALRAAPRRWDCWTLGFYRKRRRGCRLKLARWARNAVVRTSTTTTGADCRDVPRMSGVRGVSVTAARNVGGSAAGGAWTSSETPPTRHRLVAGRASSRVASSRRGKVLPGHAVLPQSWSRSLAERPQWLPSPIAGDSCLHSRRAAHLELTNLIRPSYSSPDSIDVVFPMVHCRPRPVVRDMGLPRVRNGRIARAHVVGCPTSRYAVLSARDPVGPPRDQEC